MDKTAKKKKELNETEKAYETVQDVLLRVFLLRRKKDGDLFTGTIGVVATASAP